VNLPHKSQWHVKGSGGEPRRAVDDRYSTKWVSEPSETPWIEIDLGEVATLGGIEVYWGEQSAIKYGLESSLDGQVWERLCSTRHGEGGQDVFAFPPVDARFVRWAYSNPEPARAPEIVEINLYAPEDAASVLEDGFLAVLGHGPATLPVGGSITVDFGYERYPLGALIEWGNPYGLDFSVHLSDDGEIFRDVGRIATGNGDTDSFWWRFTTSRYFRLILHKASSADGAVVNELKLRLLNKDRMPVGQLERGARAGRSDLYPQALLGRQVYWTAIGETERPEEALFDEYGNLEPRPEFGQVTPLLRLGGLLHGAPASSHIEQSLIDGSLPIPTVTWTIGHVELMATALAQAGQALVEYRITNRSGVVQEGALVLAARPVQINPYWQHGGHAVIDAIAADGRQLWVNDRRFATFSSEPDVVSIADFDNGDVVRLIQKGPHPTVRRLRSDSGLLSGACEFNFSLEPGQSAAFVLIAPMRDGVDDDAEMAFSVIHDQVRDYWRKKIGPRRISVGDPEVSDTVEAQTALILINATQFAYKPGPRNYDRTWIRDGSSQALALLWAGMIDEAKDYVTWYSKRIYSNGMVPPILNPDGTINRGYGSDIEFDAQGEFIGIAADVYRVTRDKAFLKTIFEPVVRATKFIEELCARTNALYGPGSRFHGLLAPSISHEGYSKPSYSYWDNYFALSAWRNCEYLALEMGDAQIAAYAHAKGCAFGENVTRSLRMTAEELGDRLIHGSADREDVDPSSTSIAFEPCRVEDVLPKEFLSPTYDLSASRVKMVGEAGFLGTYTPYGVRNLNAFVSLGRYEDAYRLLAAALACRRPPGWRFWAEVVWGETQAPEYIGDMPHTWIGAEFATAIRRMLLRENGDTLELFRAVPDAWWGGEGITLRELPTAFGIANVRARRDKARATVELSLTGQRPEKISFRYPGAKQARADGKICEIRGDVIWAPSLSVLEIDF
jgi:hypothetical protein